MDNKIIFLFLFLLILLPPVALSDHHEKYRVKTKDGYTLDIRLDYKETNEVVEIVVEIKNVSGPYILTSKVFVDPEFEKTPDCISSGKVSELESRIVDGRQILRGNISINVGECQSKSITIPVFVSGLYSGCEGGCESFLEGPFVYSMERNIEKNEYSYILPVIFFCAAILIVVFLFKVGKL